MAGQWIRLPFKKQGGYYISKVSLQLAFITEIDIPKRSFSQHLCLCVSQILYLFRNGIDFCWIFVEVSASSFGLFLLLVISRRNIAKNINFYSAMNRQPNCTKFKDKIIDVAFIRRTNIDFGLQQLAIIVISLP